MNHSISFIWSSFDSVEGWNSLSIHFFAAASSAWAGAVIAADAAISANALVIIKTLALVERALPSGRSRMCSSLQRQDVSGPGSSRICSVSSASDGAEDRNGRRERNHGCDPQARNLKSIFPNGQSGNGIGAAQADPREVDDGGQNQRNKQAIAARGRNPQNADPLGLGIDGREPGHDRERAGQRDEEDRGR